MRFANSRRFLVVGIMAVVCSPYVGASDAPAELQGTWKLVSVERDGEPAQQLHRQPRLVIKGSAATHSGANFATVSADAGASPKLIDLLCSDPDRTYEGIYLIDGDTLKICLNAETDGAKDRPDDFVVKGHEKRRLLVFERDKESGQDGASGFVGLLLEFDKERGEVAINSAIKGGPAEKAGVQKGDVVLRVGSTAIFELKAAIDAVRQVKPGDELTLLVRRDGKELEIKLKVALLPFSVSAQLD